MTRWTFVLAIAALACTPARSAEACSCVTTQRSAEQERQHVIEQFKMTVAVFSAEVIAVENGRVRFKLEKAWKGDLEPEFTMQSGLRTEPDGSVTYNSCDYDFTPGKKYLVFAYAAMRASLCWYTAELKNAAATIAILNDLPPDVIRTPK